MKNKKNQVKESNLVEMIVPLMGADFIQTTEEINWENEFPDIPLPPENTQLIAFPGSKLTRLITRDKYTYEGYLLTFNKFEEPYWNPM